MSDGEKGREWGELSYLKTGHALVMSHDRQPHSPHVPNNFCADTDEGTTGAAPAPDGSSDVIAIKISDWQIHAVTALQVVPYP